MKKQVIFILCCLLALSTGKVMANSDNVAEKNTSVVSYVINLGDVSDLNEESVDALISETFVNFSTISKAESAKCSVTATISVGVASLSVTVEDDCDKIVEAAKKAIAKVKEIAKELL